MASPKSKTSKTSKTSATTSANAGVGSQLGKALVRGILGSMRR